jgi:hypothetical protein
MDRLGENLMTNIYEVKVSGGLLCIEIWLFEASSLSEAVSKAERKIARGKKIYENWEVQKSELLRGTFYK